MRTIAASGVGSYRINDKEVKCAPLAQLRMPFSLLLALRTRDDDSSFKFRNKTSQVSWDAYDERLREIGVLTKARNFLVFQVRASGQAPSLTRPTSVFFDNS
jgi:hypothetical protein